MENQQKILRYILLGVVILMSVDLGFYIDRYAFKYVDSDETIMWNAAADMAEGKFYTPKFYGQAYNTHVESLIGAGMMQFGLPVEKAVKSATIFLAYFPFWLMGFLFWRQRELLAAIAVLCLPVLLPFDWQILFGGGRGFIPGLSFATVGGLVLLFHPKQIKSIVFAFLMMGLGLVMNQNCVLVIAPFGVYYLVKHGLNVKLVGFGLMGLIPGLIWFWKARQFHEQNPMYDMHKLWDLEWKLDHLVTSESHAHELFYGLFPFHYHFGIGIVFALISILIYSKIKRFRAIFWSSLSLLLLVIFVSGFNKMTDGTSSVFFPYSRFYFGLIYVIPFLSFRWLRVTKAMMISLISIVLISFAVKAATWKERTQISHKRNTGRVVISRIDDLKIECDMISQLREKHQADIIVFHSKADTYNYGCASLKDGFISVHPNYERRYWVFKKEMYQVHKTILMLDWYGKLPQKLKEAQIPFIVAEDTGYPAIILQDNSLSLIEIYEKASLTLRKHEQ